MKSMRVLNMIEHLVHFLARRASDVCDVNSTKLRRFFSGFRFTLTIVTYQEAEADVTYNS